MVRDNEPSPSDPRFAETAEPSLISDLDEPGPPRTSPCVWGPWATIGWTLVCIVVLLVLQTITLVVFLAFHPGHDLGQTLRELNSDGNFQATATLVTTPCLIGLVALLVRLRGCRISEYLALRWPPARSAVVALVGLAVVLAGSDLLSYFQGRPLVPEVMVEFYRQSWLPYLLVAVVVLAPLGEETLFRGFLYKGLAESRAGPFTAILVSTTLFGLMHVQYDWYGMVLAGVTGLYLGIARYRTGSLPLAMLLHAVANTVASMEVAVQEHWLR
jgi:uncharacterized protein